MKNDYKQYIIISVILLIFFFQSVYSISGKSITSDEIVYISAGYSYLKTFDYKLNPEHPPLTKLISAVPLLFLNPNMDFSTKSWNTYDQWGFGREFLFLQNKNADQIVFWSRIPMILVGVLLGVYLFLFARELYGLNAGYFSLILYSFSPNILAHTRLATTDIGFTCFSFITIYYFWKYLYREYSKGLWLTGIFFGLSMASKFSAFCLVPTFVLVAAIFLYYKYRIIRPDVLFCKFKHARKLYYCIFVIFVIGIFTLIFTYGVVNFTAFFRGLRFLGYHSYYGHEAFLFGNYSITGWWYYFFAAFFIKTPVPLLILIVITIIWHRNINSNIEDVFKRDMFLIIPVSFYLLAAAICRINIGFRYILPIYPLLFVFVSQVTLIKWNKMLKYFILFGLSTWFIVSSISIAPHYLAYFNRIVGGPDNGYKYLIDSNIDWGQDLKSLAVYIKKNNIDNLKLSYWGEDSPDYRKIKYEELDCNPQSGILAVSVNNLTGFDPNHAKCFRWLQDFHPIEKIGHSIFIYNITENDILSIKRD